MAEAQTSETNISDARERLAYAYVTGDRDAIREAQAGLDRAINSSSGTPSVEVRRVIIEKDPISAATLGYLTLDRLKAIIEERSPQRYLHADELEALKAHGPAALRFIVRARSLGESVSDHLPADRSGTPNRAFTSGFMLAVARGDASDQDKIAALLQANGLGDQAET